MKLKLALHLGLLLIGFQVFGQSVSGNVSSNDEELPGATISIKGTANGAVTDFDGKYTLNGVTEGDIIVYSYVGYITQEIIYAGQKNIDISLEEDESNLDEVVIVNYGKQINTPISVVKADELSEFPNTDIGQALQGRAAGVQVTNGGSPGSQTQVTIRGLATFNNSNPLYVVDGVFADDLNSIDPSNIEKIEVLKDAASTAIYGSRGANGVILITTKKGKPGETKFNFEISTGFQNFNDRYDLLNTDQYVQYLREINTLAGRNGGPDDPVGVVNDNPSFDGNGIDTDWQDEFFKSNAPITNISAGVNGGTDKVKYNVAFSHLNQDGIYTETNFKRYTFNVNTDVKVTDFLEIGETLGVGWNETIFPEREGGRDPLFNILGSAPYLPVRSANGLFSGHDEEDINDSRNQIRIQNNRDNLRRRGNLLGSIYGKVKLFDGLTFRSQYSLNASIELTDNIDRAFEEDGRFSRNTNILTKRRVNDYRNIFTNTLNYSKTFNKHEVNGSLVYERIDRKIEVSDASGSNDVSPEIRELQLGANTTFTVPIEFVSYLGLFSYEYDNRYSVQFSTRRDKSSRLPKENQVSWFNSFSAGWNVSNEDFFESNVISNLKIRASYGETGNDTDNRLDPLVNDFNAAINGNFFYPVGGSLEPGFAPVSLNNPRKGWETQVKQNYWFDLGFLDDRLTFNFDYFNNDSEGLLVPVFLTSSTGIAGNLSTGTDQFRNVGVANVQGYEVTLGYNDNEGDFKWSAWANISSSETDVKKLSGLNDQLLFAQLNPPFEERLNRVAAGESLFHFYGFDFEGVYATDEEAALQLNNTEAAQLPKGGDARFRDVNGDGAITDEDRVVIGDPNPDFVYSFNLKGSYKGFDLGLLFNGVEGVDALNSNIFFLEGQRNVLNHGTEVLRRWQNPGDVTDVPRFRFGDDYNTSISSRFIEDASFLRLKNVTLGYTLDKKITEKFLKGALKKIRLYMQAQNLVTFTDYSGFDPEIAPFYGDTGTVVGIGIDRSAAPRPITFISGLQIQF